jgi:hypothetical protein
MLATVAVMALAATIHEIGRGSGVMRSYMKVLKNWFSTAHASWPEKPNRITATQMRFASMFGLQVTPCWFGDSTFAASVQDRCVRA